MLLSNPFASGEREMEPPVSSSRGPMGSLLWKLDWLESQRFLRNPVRKTFELLKGDLVGMDTFLQELSNEDDPNLMKKYWMKEVREICYDTEDYVDWLIHSELKIGSIGVVPHLKISRLPRTLNPRPNIASQIKEFRARLQDAGERHKRYILDNNTSPSSTNFVHSHWMPEWSREAASLLVGIDNSKEKLIKLLNNGEKQLNVISICGLGGIGKTTLAKHVLQELGWKFGCHAFVRATRKPDTRNLLRSILSQTGWRHHSEACNVQQIINHLSEHLRHTRYLIVIDDLWDTAVWDFLLRAFPDGTQSSRIITTTERENVAMACCANCSDYILKMEPYNDDDLRKLFFARVFGSEDKCPQQLKDASCEIIRKCGGVPLAVIHIAGLLTHQDKSEEWDYVERSLGSNLSISPTNEGMRKVMNLSYNGLPQCLKTCLQYVCMYPENCTIWKDDLVRRWVAEGFIEGDMERDNEAIAQSHFEELVHRGMIQAIDMNCNDQVLSCTVHPMVLDFVTSKSAEDNFITTVDYSKNARELYSKVRRLLLFYSSAKSAAKLSGMTLSQVRSLAFYGLVKCLPSIREFKFLRVLVLHLWGDQNDSTILNLSAIDRLFKLRYLKVTCNFCVQLPTQMWGLNLLETLEINAKETSVPKDIVHLKYLAHLSLPAETKLPYGMSRLRSLRTLKYFDLCGSLDEEIKSLKELSVLEELQLVLTTAPVDSVERNLNVLFSILWVLDNLKSLALVRGASVPEDSVPIIDSSSMSCPTDCLERLELHQGTCILSRLPQWTGQLGSLCILKLGVGEILKHDVDSLARLQALKFLSLYVRRSMVEPIIFSSGTFPALERFKFRSGVLCITFHPGAMPKLRRLKLCFNAYSVEYGNNMLVGIEHLLNLQEVSGRIGADIGAKESDKRMAEYALKNAISRHVVIPRFNVQIVDWIEDDHVRAKNIILSKTMKVDNGIPGKESEDNTDKNTDGWASVFSDMGITLSDLLRSEAQRMTGVWKGTKLPTEIGALSHDKYLYEQVKISSIEANPVAIYFSASWCPPCRRFTPKLIEVYKELASQGKSFEVVFVSADPNEEAFKEYFAKMPWLAVPFSDREARNALDGRFKVSGIPHLVILDPKTGEVYTEDGVEFVSEYGVEAYPFTPDRINELKELKKAEKENQTILSVLGTSARDYLISNKGGKVPISELEGKYVGLCFVVYGYGPVTEFTGLLAKIYEKLKEVGEKFEVVAVSLDPLDREESAFNESLAKMPWLAIPLGDQKCEKLVRYFELRSLPTLVLIGPDGKTLNSNVADIIEEHGFEAWEGFPYSAEKLEILAEKAKAKAASQTLESLLISGDLDFVIGKDGAKVPVSELVGKTVLLYFSAKWCVPCRAFLPTLVKEYNKIKEKNSDFEIVFISSDGDQSSFDDSFSEMPWLALPLEDERKASLKKTFRIREIPSLVAIGPTGQTVSKDAKAQLMIHGADAFPFTEERIEELQKKLDEMAKGWPQKLKHELHDGHELVLLRRGTYGCDGCEEMGSTWSYRCDECDFDLHPKCALGEEKKGEEEGKSAEEAPAGHVCEGGVCRKV